MKKLFVVSVALACGSLAACQSQPSMTQPARVYNKRPEVVLCDTRSLVRECRYGTSRDVKRAVKVLNDG